MCAHNSHFTHGQIAVAHGEATISLWPISSGKFPWIRQKEQKNYPWQLPWYVLLGNKNPEVAQPITRNWNVPNSRNHVLFTCWVRLGDKSYAKTDLKVRKFSTILSTVVDVFQVFALNKFKTLWNTHKFSLNKCSRILFLWGRCNHFSKPVLLTCEREFRSEFALLFSANEVDVFLFSLKIKGWIALAKFNWCGGFTEKGKNGRNSLRFISAFDVYNNVSVETGFKLFLSLGQFNDVWPQTWKCEPSPNRTPLSPFA